MRHFAYLTDDERGRLFAVPPEEVGPATQRGVLALALGATLYSPGTRPALDADAERAAAVGATSVVWCLEDAIPHAAVADAEANVVAALQRLSRRVADGEAPLLPLLFVRVRTPGQIRSLALAAGPALARLTGFSLPKATGTTLGPMLEAIAEVSAATGHPLYGMPILETPELAWRETRAETLAVLADVVAAHREHVLCLRVGGTDLSGLFGLRRDRHTTIWDVAVVRDCLADVVNRFTRGGEHVVTGAVWEHIPGGPRLFKPQLRQSPFTEQHETGLRQRMIDDDLDGLVREVALDKANGVLGKTVIHPAHVSVVNALLTVSRSEYDDALEVLTARGRGGIAVSGHGRMNEIGPHALWAELVSRRAAVYGVVADEAALVELLAIGQRRLAEVFAVGEARRA
ncbi:citrate lyase beta subunit [Geodermatophilus bullaregiensis]|uniref:HpcH/HpaI aldolase/citrate lyase family protein n=1 Tax=Geodermatophilus bullaregiensis TaxID=1564160 RepID=UPI0019571BEF|nr:HpcH/HpaI aldolase/citrate lyase family protein [Geodermatophilus bullaregiensis]MBM7808547.1 citrate lyase beta subunit [Geodermatophilus bullaregiensis]